MKKNSLGGPLTPISETPAWAVGPYDMMLVNLRLRRFQMLHELVTAKRLREASDKLQSQRLKTSDA